MPDPDDRHVLAAAIHGGATVILTANLHDFPPAILAGHGIVAQHPDAFLLDQFKNNPEEVRSAIRTLRLDLKSPPRTASELLMQMERQNLPAIAAALLPFAGTIQCQAPGNLTHGQRKPPHAGHRILCLAAGSGRQKRLSADARSEVVGGGLSPAMTT